MNYLLEANSKEQLSKSLISPLHDSDKVAPMGTQAKEHF